MLQLAVLNHHSGKPSNYGYGIREQRDSSGFSEHHPHHSEKATART